MSAENIGLSILGFMVLLGVVLFAVRRRQISQHQSGEAPYRWQPEQDYDVIQTGESAMTPAWPELKKLSPCPRDYVWSLSATNPLHFN